MRRTTRPTPQPGILEIALYQGGAAKLAGRENVVKLSSNENPLGPSPKAIAAYQAAGASLNRYPSTDHAGLRQAIGAVHGLEPSQIICGAGSDEIIAFLCQAYVGPGDEVIHTEHGFAMYRISTLGAGGTPVEVAEKDRHTDVDAILGAVTSRTKMVFIANPNNPTGTFIDAEDVTRLADGLPSDVILVLDGAYAEYVPGFDGGAFLAGNRENVVMTRTFSKVYGLGAMRVGWGYGPREIIDVLNRLRGPFNLSDAALISAEAAVLDTGYTDACLAENALQRATLIDGLRAAGLACDDSHANFVLARFADFDTAMACNGTLNNNGLIVRPVGSYKLPEALRITVGTGDDCARVLSVVQDFMTERRT
ncbi:MAG: histidinol-phosphate aminotransferase [Dinoroseobacter sp.]|jgi:histidinol-phosphate aminotransferase